MSSRENEVLVSVIMPVYNSEKYLKQCLDSVINQTLRSIEIICVDDGSTDGSGQILEEYRKKDPRIQILHQQNQYAGVARNNGLKIAKGKYVTFWDSDDFFDLTALEKMYKACEKDKAQICICGAWRYNGEEKQIYRTGDYLQKKYLPKARPFSYRDVPAHFFNITPPVPWNKLYLRSFVQEHELQFMPLKQENDVYFVMIALYLANAVTTVNQPLVFYRYFNTSSLTGKITATRFCTVEAFRAIQDELTRLGAFSSEEQTENGPMGVLLRQSFANKVIGPLLYALRSQTTREGFRELYDAYHDSVFPEFDLAGKPDEYFYVASDLRQVRAIEEGDPELYLHQEMNTYWREVLVLRGKASADRRLKEIEESTSYRVGRAVTWLPRKLKDLRN